MSGGSISCADQIDRVSDPEWPLRAAQVLKPQALPGDTYSRLLALIAIRTSRFLSGWVNCNSTVCSIFPQDLGAAELLRTIFHRKRTLFAARKQATCRTCVIYTTNLS